LQFRLKKFYIISQEHFLEGKSKPTCLSSSSIKTAEERAATVAVAVALVSYKI
jgi:hypothetical protein